MLRYRQLTLRGQPPSNANRVLYLAFTSGTTGVPKGVMHSDNTLLANARALSSDWNINNESVVYSLSPLSHNLGFGAMIMALAVGGQFVIHDLPRSRSLVDRLIETGTTFLVGVPTHAIDLLAEVKFRSLSGVGKLQGFRISGAAAPQQVIAELLKFGITPQSGYGMTETCSHQYTLPSDDPKLIVESCGKSCSGYEIRIFDRGGSQPRIATVRDRSDRWSWREPDARLFRRPEGDGRVLQPRWLVHDRRSRLGRRKRLSA